MIVLQRQLEYQVSVRGSVKLDELVNTIGWSAKNISVTIGVYDRPYALAGNTWMPTVTA